MLTADKITNSEIQKPNHRYAWSGI